MSDLAGTVGEINMTIEIIRANGKVETMELVGFVNQSQLDEVEHGRNP